MDKNFSFTLAVKKAFEFMISDAKTFFIPAAGAFALLWISGFAVAHFFPFNANTGSANISFIYGLVMFSVRAILMPAIALVFITVFYQKMKDKKLSNPDQESVLKLMLFAVTGYILPVFILSGSMFLIFILLSSGYISMPALISLFLILLALDIAYLVFFTLNIFSPYFYLEQKSFIRGLKQSISTVKEVFVKMFLLVLGFLIIFSIIYSVPNITSLILRSTIVTPELIKIISAANIASFIILVIYLAFSTAVLTRIYIQMNEKSALEITM